VKPLIFRGDATSTKLTDHLFELFSDSSINWDAASAIGTIVASSSVLTKQNYAVVKVFGYCELTIQTYLYILQFLYAQRFANAFLPRIISGAQSSLGSLFNHVMTTILNFYRSSDAEGSPYRSDIFDQVDTKETLRSTNADCK
jgi:RNAPII transcription regulator C-terminal